MKHQLLSKDIRHSIEKACFDGLTPKVQVLIKTAIMMGETPKAIAAVCKQTLVKYGLHSVKAGEIANQYLNAAHYVKRTGACAISTSDHSENIPGNAV